MDEQDQPQIEPQADDAIPTYDESFPSLPELSETRRVMAEAQKVTWAASAIKPSLTTQVLPHCQTVHLPSHHVYVPLFDPTCRSSLLRTTN